MPSKPIQKICQHCNCAYLAKDERKSRPSKYCSRKCRDLAQTTRVDLVCSECGCQFQRKAYMAEWSQERGPFCSFQCYGGWQSKNCSGANNPFHNPDAHQTLTCTHCETDFHRPKYVRSGESPFCSRDCFQSYAAENYTQQMPVSYGKSWIARRKQAIERDGRKCQYCQSETDLVVHHIREYRTFGDVRDAHELDNLVTLCRACHRRQHNQ